MLKYIFAPHRRQQLFALANQSLTAAYGLLLFMVMLRFLPQAEAGRWLLFVAAVSMIDMLLNGLLQTAAIKEISIVKEEKNAASKIITNAAAIGFVFYLIISALAIGVMMALSIYHIDNILFHDLAIWYPVAGFTMLIYNITLWWNSGRSDFRSVFIQRMVFSIVSVLIMAAYYFREQSLNFSIAVIALSAGYLCSALLAFIQKGQLKISIHYLSRKIRTSLLHYGKYTIGTMLGSSLLRSADAFMIAGFINAGAVAIYAAAQKLTEVFEVLLRSVAVTALPMLYGYRNDTVAFSHKLLLRMVMVTLVFIPAAILIAVLSCQVITLISGFDDVAQSALILRIFMLYVLLLPCDRLLGVALEACNLPQFNLMKTFAVVMVNIVGNFIALQYFHSLTGVAMVSIFALSAGIITGFYLLFKKVSLPVKQHVQNFAKLQFKLQ